MKLFPDLLGDKWVLPIWCWLDRVEDVLTDQRCLEIFPRFTHLLESPKLESFLVLFGVIKGKLELFPGLILFCLWDKIDVVDQNGEVSPP